MGSTRLVATLTAKPSPEGGEIAALPARVGVLEVRADLTGDLEPADLRRHFGGELLYTLRSRAEGGAWSGDDDERRRRLTAAAVGDGGGSAGRSEGRGGYDLVDLEGERDLHSPLLDAIPPEKRLVSWHGPPTDLDGLGQRFERLSVVDARYYKLIPTARQPGEELAPLQLLQTLGREDVVAFAAGDVGVWTRLVAPRLGAPLVYGSAGEDPAAPGQPSVARLVRDYGLPELRPLEGLFGIVGHPTAHSLSPRLHNGAYRELGLPYLYLPFDTPSFGDFWLEVVESSCFEPWGLPLRGLSVTSPYKATALAVAGAASPLVECIGGANTLVLHDGVWEAESTDPDGVVGPLIERGVSVAGCRAAVWGTGGAGRAAAVGLARAGAEVTLVNRTEERGRAVAEALEMAFSPLNEVDPGDFELLVHATPLGRSDDDPLPLDPAAVRVEATVVDMVYRDLAGGRPTALVAALQERGIGVVEGREMLLHQAFAQFRLMTGHELPPDLGRRLLGLDDPVAPGAPAASPTKRDTKRDGEEEV